MSTQGERFARGINAFVQNPITNLLKGIALLLIGVIDASRSFHEDLNHWHLHVGHGLIIIGVFSILGALPHFADGLESASRFLESRQDSQPEKEPTPRE